VEALLDTVDLEDLISQKKVVDMFMGTNFASLFSNTEYTSLKGIPLEYTLKDFSEEVFEFGNRVGPKVPYHYSSYQFFQANKELQQYKFYNYVNLTSKDVVAHFPQYMYESILKVANDNPEFEFKVRNTPYPVLYMTENAR